MLKEFLLLQLISGQTVTDVCCHLVVRFKVCWNDEEESFFPSVLPLSSGCNSFLSFLFSPLFSSTVSQVFFLIFSLCFLSLLCVLLYFTLSYFILLPTFLFFPFFHCDVSVHLSFPSLLFSLLLLSILLSTIYYFILPLLSSVYSAFILTFSSFLRVFLI